MARAKVRQAGERARLPGTTDERKGVIRTRSLAKSNGGLCTTSPSPDWLPPPGTAFSWWITAMMVREIRLNSGARVNGTTGWMFSW